MMPFVPWSCASALVLVGQETGSSVAAPVDPRSEGTLAMAARLAEIAARQDPERIQWLSRERVPVMRAAVARALGKGVAEANARLDLAVELLQSNEPESALAELALAETAAATGGSLPAALARKLRSWRAISWLRLGEVENCLARHVCESCILPIAHGAQHVERRGSENAIREYEALLADDPEDRESRWLLNVAHMTLGTWPDGVPERFRLPATAFASDREFPRFKDVSADCGVDLCVLSGGIVTEDLDGDARLDLVMTSMGPLDRMWVYRNRGDGTFEERAMAAGLEGITGGLNLIHGDYDNDGDVDLFVLRGGWFGEEGAIPNSLLRNRGDGNFDDVTVEAGVLSLHPTQTGVFTDVDLDGWLDLVIGNESIPGAGTRDRCELFLNQRDGTFRDVASEVGAAIDDYVKGVAAGDFDNDGRVDLFYSCRGGVNRLLKNEQSASAPGFRFRDVANAARVELPRMSFPAWFFDYDNDGWQDLYVGVNPAFGGDRTEEVWHMYAREPRIAETPRLFRNEKGKFRDVTSEMGVGRAGFVMGCNFGDLDNDGWLDLYLGTGAPDFRALLPNKMFRNAAGKRFEDVTTAGGFGHLQKGHGIAFADLDDDGDQDVVARMGGGFTGDIYRTSLYENPGFAGARFVTLRLRGTRCNRSAVGARIAVQVVDDGGLRTIHVTVGTGASFGSSSLQQEIGLGEAFEIAAVEVRWPGDPKPQRFTGVPLDSIVELVQDRAEWKKLEAKPFRLGRAPAEAAGK